MRNKLVSFGILLLFIALSLDLNAQCAMCKAVVETNLEEGGNKIGNGLNTGILYLMSIPYILILGFGFSWHLQNKETKQ